MDIKIIIIIILKLIKINHNQLMPNLFNKIVKIIPKLIKIILIQLMLLYIMNHQKILMLQNLDLVIV